MSMHAMEELVECSVLTIVAAQPAPANARDLCHSLYTLQDYFDCSYTILRVPDGLERLGYLRRLAPDKLPLPERKEILALAGESGFIGASPQSYFDGKSGLCCVTAGSPMWEKLCKTGVLSGADTQPVRVLPALDLAEQISELAAARADENALQTMGLWYGLFLGILLIDGDAQELAPRMLALRDRLAVPQALAIAGQWGLLSSADTDGALDLIEEQWLAPYTAMKKEPKALMRRALEALQRQDYAAASALAAGLPEETARVYLLSLASLGHHQMLAAGEELGAFEGLMPLEAVCDGFVSILGRQPEIDSLCRANLAAAQFLLGEHWKAFITLQDAFATALEKIQNGGDEWSRRFGEAALAIAFYHTVMSSMPDSAPEKQQLLTRRAGKLLTVQEARDAMASLPSGRPEQAWACHYQIGICWLLEGNYEMARRELGEAERLHPGDPDVKAAMDALSGRERG